MTRKKCHSCSNEAWIVCFHQRCEECFIVCHSSSVNYSKKHAGVKINKIIKGNPIKTWPPPTFGPRHTISEPLFIFTSFQLFLFSFAFVFQPAVKPPGQKAKSPAPQPPAGTPEVKLGPRGACVHSQTTEMAHIIFCLHPFYLSY